MNVINLNEKLQRRKEKSVASSIEDNNDFECIRSQRAHNNDIEPILDGSGGIVSSAR